MKKHVSMLVAIILCMSMLFSACSQSTDGDGTESSSNTEEKKQDDAKTEDDQADGGVKVNPPGTFPIVDEMVTLKVLVPTKSNLEDIETNAFTKYYEELTNVKIEWEVVPENAVGERVNTVIASGGPYPDIFMDSRFSYDEQRIYAQSNLFLDITEYADDYAPNFKMINENHDYATVGRQHEDGAIYSFTKISEWYPLNYMQGAYVYQPWLDQLGLDYPETTDDFYNMLVAFKENDMNGDGDATNEIPLSGGTGWRQRPEEFLLNSFLYYDQERDYSVYDKDTKTISFSFDQPEYKEGLKYINKLYEEGLLDIETYTQDEDMYKQKLQGKPETVGAMISGHKLETDSTSDLWKDFVCISPLTGPEGVKNQYTSYTDSRSDWDQAIVISSTTEYPEVAVRWADGLYELETSLRAMFGPEGDSWELADESEGLVGLNGKPAVWKRLQNKNEVIQNDHWAHYGVYYLSADVRGGQAVEEADPMDNFDYDTFDYAKNKREPYAISFEDQRPYLVVDESVLIEFNDLKNAMNEYVGEMRVRFITGDLDLDSDWDNYLNELKNIGYDRYMELYQQSIDNSVK